MLGISANYCIFDAFKTFLILSGLLKGGLMRSFALHAAASIVLVYRLLPAFICLHGGRCIPVLHNCSLEEARTMFFTQVTQRLGRRIAGQIAAQFRQPRNNKTVTAVFFTSLKISKIKTPKSGSGILLQR